MAEYHDQHADRNLDVVDEPLDAASQSLADALRSSFKVLKGIMAILIVLFLFSNIRGLDSHEQALVLRLGRLLPGVREAGLVWSFPFPIDEIIPLPTRRSNDLLIDSQSFRRRPTEVGKPLAFITRTAREGLHPTLDGALLTADAGLVHVQWKVTYKIDDVSAYVSTIYGDGVEAAQGLIQTMIETVGVQVASELKAEEIIRTRVVHVQREMKRRVNERLRLIGSGINVTLVEMYEPTPPLQIRRAFDETQRAENVKQQKIRAAEKQRTQILNEAAGATYLRFVSLLDRIDQAESQGGSTIELRAELDRMLLEEAEGKAGQRIKQAGAYRAGVVTRMVNDVNRYRMLLPEYKRSPMLLINRLWERTRKDLFENTGVTQFYRPSGLLQFRVKIPLDPEQSRQREAQQLEKEQFDEAKLLRPKKIVPLGPEYD